MKKARTPAAMLAGFLMVALTLVPGASTSLSARGGARAGSQLLRMVIVDDAGAAVAGARIRLRADNRSWWAQSASDGAVLLSLRENVDGVDLDVTHEDYSDYRNAISLKDHLEPWRITLERQSHLQGIVLGPQGVPVERVEVFLVGSGLWPAKHVYTNQRGEFEFYNLRAGIYEISARKNELIAAPVAGIQAQAGVSHRLTLQLSVGEKLTGQIVDARTLAPIANAQVWAQRRATSIESMQLELDSKARFEIIVGDNDVPVLYVEAPGYLALGPYFWPNNTNDARIVLLRGKTLRGRVIDADGNPIQGVTIRVEFGQSAASMIPAAIGLSGAGLASGMIGTTTGAVPKVNSAPASSLSAVQATRSQQTESDARGEFTMQSLPEGTLHITLDHPDFASLQIWGAARSDVQTFKLVRGGSVLGRVIDAKGIPVEGIQIEVQSEDAPSLWLQSDANGEFVSRRLHGKVVITARPANGTAERVEVQLRGGEQVRTEIRISQGHLVLEGRVISQNQDAVVGAALNLRSLNAAQPGKWTQLSDSEGLFAFAALHEGAYQLSIEQANYLPQSLTLQIPAQKVQVQLQHGLRVEGLVVDDFNNQPVSNVMICFTSARENCARSDRSGKFSLARVPEGVVTLSVSHERYATLHQSTTARADSGAYDAPFILSEPLRMNSAGNVEGDVVDAYGAPVDGATLSIAGETRNENSSVSDKQGHFVISHVAAGDQWLSATHRYAGSVERAGPVRVYSGQTSRGMRIQLPRTVDQLEQETPNDWRSGVPIAIRLLDSRVVVSALFSDDPNVIDGIRVGDVLLAIDDRPVTTLELAQAALLGPVNTEVVIRVQRADLTNTLITQRVRYDATTSTNR